MKNPEELRKLFEDSLQKIVFPVAPKNLYAPIQYTLDHGGKRIRPVLLMMACDIVGGNSEKAMNAAMGIELFHNFTLIHDDIMDQAPLRRGKPTVDNKFGSNAAIISGDLMMIYAGQFMSKTEVKFQISVNDTFYKAAIKVCEGQQYDLDFEKNEEISLNDYILMIEHKTAALLAGCLKIGALIGDASEEIADHFYEFGRNIGIAFQLKDDILDAFADDVKFGKQLGGDILMNKKTYLLVKARELADQATTEQLDNFMFGGNYDQETKVREVTALYRHLGVEEQAEKEMLNYLKAADDHLSATGVGDDKLQPLREYASFLIEREF